MTAPLDRHCIAVMERWRDESRGDRRAQGLACDGRSERNDPEIRMISVLCITFCSCLQFPYRKSEICTVELLSYSSGLH